MDECDFLGECKFFLGELSSVPDNSEELKEYFCRKNYLKCACYMASNVIGPASVPEDLFPEDKNRAYMIIAENS